MSGLDVGGFDDDPAYQDEWRRLEGDAAEREASFVADFRLAAKGDPDLVGEAQQLAAKLGQPLPAVEADIQTARASALSQELRYQDLARSHPQVLRSLENIQFKRLATDDLQNLIATDSVWQAMGRKYAAGQAMTERGFIGSRLAMGLTTQQQEAQRLAEIDEVLRNAAGDSGFLVGSAEMVGQMSETVPRALATGAATGLVASAFSPAAGAAAFSYGTGTAFFAQSAAIEGGSTYLELIDQGVPHDQARVYALAAGLIKGGLEVVGARAVALPFKAAAGQIWRRAAGGVAQETAGRALGKALASYAKALGGEVSTEVLQEITDVVTEAAARQPGQPEPTWGEIGDRLSEIAGKTLEGMALLAVPGPTLQFVSQAERAQRATERAEVFEAVSARAAESKVRQRNPEQYAEFAQRVAEQQGIQDVFIDAPLFAQAMQTAGVSRADLEAQLPTVFEQLEKAEAHADVQIDVVLRAGEFQAKLARTPLGDALMEHVRFDQDGMSAQEAKTWQKDRQKLAGDMAGLVTGSEQADRELADSAKAVENTIYEQIRATGQLPDAKQARSAAVFYRSFYATQAADLGMTPEEMHAQFPVQFEAANQAGAQDLRAARGSFDPTRLVVKLFEKADASSFLHEGAHFFLHTYGEIARRGAATLRMQEDTQTLLDWFGVKDVDTWNGMSLEQQRQHHEKFAYSFEGYLFDGKAPSKELEPLFDRFKRWLRALYRGIRDTIGAAYRREFGEDLPILTGEVRQVMDRMLASEDAVATMQAVRDYLPLFQTQEQSGMSDEAWAAYQAADREQRAAALDSLERTSLRQMQWVSGSRARVLKEMQAKHDTLRQQVRVEVEREVAATPRDRARRWLKDGQVQNADGTTSTAAEGTVHRLDTDAVRELLPAGTNLTSSKLRGMHQEGGLAPDVVAEQFGFTSGEQLVAALVEMEPFKTAVDRRTDERMLAEHSELADPEEVEAAVDRALHNEARIRMVAAELRHLEKTGQPARVMLAAAKEAAKQTIAKMAVREVHPKRFAAAETRARRSAMEAVRRGDTDAAIDWKRKEMLQHALAQVAIDVQAELEQQVRDLARFRKPDEQLAKTRNTNLVNAARWILSRYNLGTPSQEQTAQRAIDSIRKYDETTYQLLEPLLLDAAQGATNYPDLTVEQAQQLFAQVDSLWFQSRRSREVMVDGKTVARGDVKQQILETLEPRLKGDPKPHALTKGERRKRSFGSIRASLRHVESLVLQWDGGKPGALHRHLFALIREPYDTYQIEKNRLVKSVFERAKTLSNLHGQRIAAPELGTTFRDRGELVAALLHAGNEQNLRKNGVGRGWFERPRDQETPVDLSAWWRFVDRMVREKKLTKEDFDFAQFVWDTFENDLKPQAQRAHFDNYGLYMQEVEAMAFETEFGTYRGGYFPAKADPDWVLPQPGQKSVDGVTESGQAMLERHPSTGKGFAVTRTEVNRPLLQDIRLVAQAFDEELRFIHLQRPGRDIAALLNDQEIAGAIQQIDPNALEDTLFPWLGDTLQNRVMAPGGHPVLNRFLVRVRRSVGLAYMFGNVANALQQPTGLANAALYVPLRFLRSAAAGFATSPRETARRVTELSDFMRLRLDNQVGQLVDDIDELLDPTVKGKVQAWVNRNGYFLQRAFQNPVDIITWSGAFDQAIAEGKTEKQAVRWGDTAVRRSQGSGTAADISKAERATALGRLFTQFSTFWLSQFNAIMQREGGERVQAAAVVIGLSGVLAGAISQALKGGWDDEDDDGALWDDVTGWAFAEAGRSGAAALLPIGGPLAFAGLTGDRGGRLTPGAVFGAGEQAFRGVRSAVRVATDEQRDLRGQDIKDVATLLSILSGIPVTLPARPAGYGFDVLQGNVEPEGTADAVRGLVVGR